MTLTWTHLAEVGWLTCGFFGFLKNLDNITVWPGFIFTFVACMLFGPFVWVLS